MAQSGRLAASDKSALLAVKIRDLGENDLVRELDLGGAKPDCSRSYCEPATGWR